MDWNPPDNIEITNMTTAFNSLHSPALSGVPRVGRVEGFLFTIMSTKRKPLSKKTRFEVLNRDNFTCRYCGVHAESAELAIDHILPVSRGGGDESINLVASCIPCNSGKSNKLLNSPLPMSKQVEELHRRLDDQRKAAKAFRAIQRAKKRERQDVVNYLCELLGADTVKKSNVGMLCGMIDEFDRDTVYSWMEIAARKVSGNETNLCKYVCGIRRNTIQKAEEAQS